MKLFKNARVIDPVQQIDQVMDIRVNGNQIFETGVNLVPNSQEEIIDLAGKILTTGFVDLHVHLREPGEEYKEDVESGARAAAAGGFTGICPMPNTKPVCDNDTITEMLVIKGQRTGLVNIYPVGAITKNQDGKELAEIGMMKKRGARALSDDGRDVMNSLVMRRALDYAKAFQMPVFAHCEDTALAGHGSMNEGYYSSKLGLGGIPKEAENIMVMRNIMLAGLTNGHMHISHMTTKEGLELIRQAKKEGHKVTCEVTPHHFSLTEAAVESYDTNYKVNPPLRTQKDIEVLIQGMAEGIVDVIATDHAPHDLEDKDKDFSNAAFGISGLETATALTMDILYHKHNISLMRIAEMLSSKPREILGLPEQKIASGNIADFTIIDPELSKKADKGKFYSKGKNTPFHGVTLKGWPVMTVFAGKIVMKDGEVIEQQ